MTMIDHDRLQAIVRQAGHLAMAHWPGAGHALHVWEKTAGELVSEADLAVDTYLKDELGALLPGSGWLSEETVDDTARLDREFCWVVDPIDGTRDFVRGRTGWSVSVALVGNGQPLIGILNAPARDEFWFAAAGQGATRNGERLIASARPQLPGARVPADGLPKADHDLVAVEKPNSIALRIAMIAADEADLLATLRWGAEWDIAAACLIASEAGAAVSDAYGAPFGFNKRDPGAFGVLVTAPAIHTAALERLETRYPPRDGEGDRP